MPTTEPIHGWPVPEDTDPGADGAQAITDLATAIAADVVVAPSAALLIQTGSVEVLDITALGLGVAIDQTVTFPVPFSAKPLFVRCNEASARGGSATFVSRAISSGWSATDFRLLAYNTADRDVTCASHTVTWMAIGPV